MTFWTNKDKGWQTSSSKYGRVIVIATDDLDGAKGYITLKLKREMVYTKEMDSSVPYIFGF